MKLPVFWLPNRVSVQTNIHICVVYMSTRSVHICVYRHAIAIRMAVEDVTVNTASAAAKGLVIVHYTYLPFNCTDEGVCVK